MCPHDGDQPPLAQAPLQHVWWCGTGIMPTPVLCNQDRHSLHDLDTVWTKAQRIVVELGGTTGRTSLGSHTLQLLLQNPQDDLVSRAEKLLATHFLKRLAIPYWLAMLPTILGLIDLSFEKIVLLFTCKGGCVV